jgi:HAD superfamily hydrolase (TIGR01509 family)
MPRYEAVILDMDGTLVDSNWAHARAWVDALREHGYEPPYEQVLPLIGMGGDQLLPIVADGLQKSSPLGSAIAARKKAIFHAHYFPQVRPFPGVRALVERMRQDGLAVVVGTSSGRNDAERLLDMVGITDLIDSATSADDAKRSKPAPDIVLAALAKTGKPAARVLMVGDTPYDIQAAEPTGVGVIALRCGGWQDEQLQGALEIYDSPADLLAHYAESALGQTTR